MATKLDKGKLYSCLSLQPFKGKGAKGKESYLFAISKAEQVFDYLAEKPPLGELRNKRYCKWHNAYNHSTVNCLVFKNTIQQALKQGGLSLVEKGNKMQVDTNPFH
ncbi:hypothetical protein JHK86_042797 [Glycine max]|nr:hypothetical protein JHK86_042797 [Glycine max]